MGSQASSLHYWWVIWLNWETYLQEHAHFLHTQKKRLDQYLCLPKGWMNWAERWRLKIVGEAAQSPTGSDLMSKKTCACFCSVSFLLCSDRYFLSPVGMDTGVIRPSIPPTPTHRSRKYHSAAMQSLQKKIKNQTLSANSHSHSVFACVAYECS